MSKGYFEERAKVFTDEHGLGDDSLYFVNEFAEKLDAENYSCGASCLNVNAGQLSDVTGNSYEYKDGAHHIVLTDLEVEDFVEFTIKGEDQVSQTLPNPTASSDSMCVNDSIQNKWWLPKSESIELNKRAKWGLKKYGQPLVSHDGRPTVRDFREEHLDASVYAVKLGMETGNKFRWDLLAMISIGLSKIVSKWDTTV